MSEKPKRKNAEPTPRRYWWIFGTLAIVLLIGIWFPVRLKASYEMNLIFHCLIGITCILGTIHFVRRFHWRRQIVVVMLACILLTVFGLADVEPFNPLYHGSCITDTLFLFSADSCNDSIGCYQVWSEYIGIKGFPIVMQTSFGEFGLCILF